MDRSAGVLILGGGYAGLAAAHRLARDGVRSMILEASDALGGLARCMVVDGHPIERFYHHIKPEDRHILDLIEELGLGPSLRWSDTRMGFYIGGRFHPFSTPIDLLRFSPLPPLDRFRFALGVLKAKRTDGKTLEGMSAEEWVLRQWGRAIYDRIMHPMLLNKFGIPPARISAGFLQGRIKGLSSAKSKFGGGESLAYLGGGLDALTARWSEALRDRAEFRLASPVEQIERTPRGFDVRSATGRFCAPFLINTLPLVVFDAVAKNFESPPMPGYQAVACAVFAVREELTPFYWVNVLDPEITFRILVNQSRIHGDYRNTMVYCGNYLGQDDPMLRKPEEEILDLYKAGLERMFGEVTVLDAKLSRSRFATPIFDKDFASRTAGLDDAVPGMVFAGNVKIYPYSRTVSSVIATGYAAAKTVLERMGKG